MRIFILSLFVLFCVSCHPAIASHKNLNLTDLKKAVSVFKDANSDISEDCHLGTHESKDSNRNRIVNDIELFNYAFGDLNGDGLGDAIVFIGQNIGGTGFFMSLVAFINDHGKAKSVDSVYFGDRIACKSLKIINRKVIFHALIHNPRDPRDPCWGTVPKTFIYRLTKNKLVGPRKKDGF
jgi:hypothetical protein